MLGSQMTCHMQSVLIGVWISESHPETQNQQDVCVCVYGGVCVHKEIHYEDWLM